MSSLFQELKRRKVFRVAAAYTVVAWVLIEVADVVLPTFGAPEWVNQTVIFLFALGFVPTIIAAWALDVTPQGVRIDEGATSQQSSSAALHPINYLILAIVVVVAGFQVANQFFVARDANRQAADVSADLSPATTPSLQVNLTLGELPGSSLALPVPGFTVTPDGTRLIYNSWDGAFGRIQVRDLATGTMETIWEREAFYPFQVRVSPNGDKILFQQIASRTVFFGRLIVLPLDSPDDVTITENFTFSTEGAIWVTDDLIVFQDRDRRMLTYSLESEESSLITVSSTAFNLRNFTHPVLLPDGETLLVASSDTEGNARIESVSLIDGSRGVVLENAFAPTYLDRGYLLFARDNSIWAARFNEEELRLEGTSARLVTGVENYTVPYYANYSVSQTGLLVYLPGGRRDADTESKHILWVDRNGNEETLRLPVMDYSHIEISPDGERLAFSRIGVEGDSVQPDIWTHRFSQPGIINRITYSGGAVPIWSRDGTRIFYGGLTQNIGLADSVWVVDANGTGDAEKLFETDGLGLFLLEQPAGDSLLYTQVRQLNPVLGGVDRLTRTDDAWLSTSLINRPFIESAATISPDGRWMAYHSTDTSGAEGLAVFIRPYPNVDDNRWRINLGLGMEPLWSRDGRLHYMTRRGDEFFLVSVQLDAENNFEVINSEELPVGMLNWNAYNLPNYAIHPDGDRVLVNRPGSAPGMSTAGGSTRLINPVLINNISSQIERLLSSN